MGLLRMAARTAVVAGTATAVSGRVQRRQNLFELSVVGHIHILNRHTLVAHILRGQTSRGGARTQELFVRGQLVRAGKVDELADARGKQGVELSGGHGGAAVAGVLSGQ